MDSSLLESWVEQGGLGGSDFFTHEFIGLGLTSEGQTFTVNLAMVVMQPFAFIYSMSTL